MGILLEYFGNTMGLWDYYGNVMEMLWEGCRNAMGILWECYGNTTRYGNTVGVLVE